jgi:hypothetical protein
MEKEADPQMMLHCFPRLRPPTARFLAATLLTLATSCTAWAAEPPSSPKEKNESADQRQQFYRKVAAEYDVRYQDAAKTRLDFQSAPVMHWSSINNYDGSVFIWTHMGRPELIGTIFSSGREGSPYHRVLHEFHAFSLAGLSVVAPAGPQWEPKGVEGLKLLPDAPVPAETAVQRQTQVKNLARQFTGHLFKRGERWELRLLPQPLYKYDGGGADILGGGVFTFVAFITDPEIILLLEARRTPQGPKWHYYPARFSDRSLFLEYRNKTIWESLRAGHGTSQPDTIEPQYRVIKQETVRLPVSGPVERLDR